VREAAPLWKLLIKQVVFGIHLVAQWLEQAAHELLPPSAVTAPILSGGERRIRTVSTTPVVIYRKVKLDSQTLRLVIANHSPRVFAKTDLCSATREKARGNVFS
jgi:hypothetical protein